MSVTSQGLNSSIMGSSDDEGTKAKKAAETKKTGKGFTDAELETVVDIELVETETTVWFTMPAITGVHETPEY